MQRQKPSPKRTSQASWVPSEVNPARAKAAARKRAASGSGASRWLPAVVKRAGGRNRHSNGDGGGNRHASAQPAKPRAKRPKLPKRASPHEHWLILRLRRAKRRLAERDDEIERLRERVAELEKQVAGRSETQRPRRADKSSQSDGRLNVNNASFDELRALGLTVSQSSRLISHRDVNGGFDSVDEIEELPGFGKATLELLRSRAHAQGS